MDYSLWFLISLFVLLGTMLKFKLSTAVFIFTLINIFMFLVIVAVFDSALIKFTLLIIFIGFVLMSLYRGFMVTRILREIKE